MKWNEIELNWVIWNETLNLIDLLTKLLEKQICFTVFREQFNFCRYQVDASSSSLKFLVVSTLTVYRVILDSFRCLCSKWHSCHLSKIRNEMKWNVRLKSCESVINKLPTNCTCCIFRFEQNIFWLKLKLMLNCELKCEK